MNMFGNTEAEVRETISLLHPKSKRWGNFFRWIYTIMGTVVCIFLLTGDVFEPKLKLLLLPLMLIGIIMGYWLFYIVGYVFYWGYVIVSFKLKSMGVRKSDIAIGAASGITLSYFLGGRRAARTSFMLILIVLGITVCVGFYIGLFFYIKYRTQIKRVAKGNLATA